jgi:hypothetical protein
VKPETYIVLTEGNKNGFQPVYFPIKHLQIKQQKPPVRYYAFQVENQNQSAEAEAFLYLQFMNV